MDDKKYRIQFLGESKEEEEDVTEVDLERYVKDMESSEKHEDDESFQNEEPDAVTSTPLQPRGTSSSRRNDFTAQNKRVKREQPDKVMSAVARPTAIRQHDSSKSKRAKRPKSTRRNTLHSKPNDSSRENRRVKREDPDVVASNAVRSRVRPPREDPKRRWFSWAIQ